MIIDILEPKFVMPLPYRKLSEEDKQLLREYGRQLEAGNNPFVTTAVSSQLRMPINLYVDMNAHSTVLFLVRQARDNCGGQFCDNQNIGYMDEGHEVRKWYYHFRFPYSFSKTEEYKMLVHLAGHTVKENGLWIGYEVTHD